MLAAEGPAPASGASASRRIWRAGGFAVGVLLLAGAVWAVWRQSADAERAWHSLRASSPWLIVAALILPALNWLIVSYSFYVLMRRYGEVRPWEMAMLIGAAWLGNYLPLRPGMVGRIAYHRAVNRIGVPHSIRALVLGMSCGLAAVASIIAVSALMARTESRVAWSLGLAAPGVVGLIAWAVLRVTRPAVAFLPLTFAIRCADMIVWVLRYAVVFALVGAPLSPAGAAAVTGAGQVAMTVPFVGNGLGIREWAVGLTAGALPGQDPGRASPAGLEADLVNRIAELLVAVPVGLVSYWGLVAAAARRRGRG